MPLAEDLANASQGVMNAFQIKVTQLEGRAASLAADIDDKVQKSSDLDKVIANKQSVVDTLQATIDAGMAQIESQRVNVQSSLDAREQGLNDREVAVKRQEDQLKASQSDHASDRAKVSATIAEVVNLLTRVQDDVTHDLLNAVDELKSLG